MKPTVADDGNWPDAGAPPIDFIATLPTANRYLQRPLWGRQIEKSYDWTQF